MSDLAALTLQRVKQTQYATYGRLGEFVTIELPWAGNAHSTSCIPAGTYTAERYLSPHHGYVVFRLVDVPQRDYVEIHIANLPSDLLGCIGIGQTFGIVTKASGETGDGILASKAAFHSFMIERPEQRFRLTILDVAPAVVAEVPDAA